MRKIVFVAAMGMIVLGGIFVLSRESFYAKQSVGQRIWKTVFYAANNQVASVGNFILGEPSFSLPVPLYLQERRLSCEAAALRMALGYYFIEVSEDELLEKLVFDTKAPIVGGVWGDPEMGFVGDVNGSLTNGTGYGVYEYPIQDLARKYRPAVVLQNPNLSAVINSIISGKPVIVWNIISKHPPLYWLTREGKEIEAHLGEHARVVVGFTGPPYDPRQITLHDPIYGRISVSTGKFLAEWQALGSRAVVLY